MIYLVYFCVWYFSCGMGFALASWLQAAEVNIRTGEPINDKDSGWKTTLFFVLAWWVVAIYCYRVEVKRSMLPVDFDELKDKAED